MWEELWDGVAGKCQLNLERSTSETLRNPEDTGNTTCMIFEEAFSKSLKKTEENIIRRKESFLFSDRKFKRTVVGGTVERRKRGRSLVLQQRKSPGWVKGTA